MSFIKESLKEFDHVVWPTPAETKKYFVTVVSMIIALTILLFVIGSVFSTALFEAKKLIAPSVSTTVPTTAIPGDLKLNNMETTATPAVPTE